MLTCDICNHELGSAVPFRIRAAEMRAAVVGGYDPTPIHSVMLRLEVAGIPRGNLSKGWREFARIDTEEWQLCRGCYLEIRPHIVAGRRRLKWSLDSSLPPEFVDADPASGSVPRYGQLFDSRWGFNFPLLLFLLLSEVLNYLVFSHLHLPLRPRYLLAILFSSLNFAATIVVASHAIKDERLLPWASGLLFMVLRTLDRALVLGMDAALQPAPLLFAFTAAFVPLMALLTLVPRIQPLPLALFVAFLASNIIQTTLFTVAGAQWSDDSELIAQVVEGMIAAVISAACFCLGLVVQWRRRQRGEVARKKSSARAPAQRQQAPSTAAVRAVDDTPPAGAASPDAQPAGVDLERYR